MDILQEIEDASNLSKTLFEALMFSNANTDNDNHYVTLAYLISEKIQKLQTEIYK